MNFLDFSSSFGEKSFEEQFTSAFSTDNSSTEESSVVENISSQNSASISLDDARTSYFQTYFDATMIAERVCDGEVVDEAEVLGVFKSLRLTYDKYCELRAAAYPNSSPIPLIRYGVAAASPEVAMEANRLIGEGNLEKDIEKIEHGKWLLFCAGC